MLELLAKPAQAKSSRRSSGKPAKAAPSRKPYPPIPPGTPMRVAEPYTPYGASNHGKAIPFAVLTSDPFKISAVENLATTLEIPSDHLMALLGIAGRTAQRRWHEGELTLDESDRLYRIARIAHRAIEVLGSQEGARHWLKRPQAFFAGSAPLGLLGSDAGAKAVEDQLGRIEHGIFA